MATQREVLTIGHSNHTIERLIELLCQHHVTAVADIRSSPYSQMNTQFNREGLASALKQAGIAHSFLGKEQAMPASDYSCPKCRFWFQLKSQKSRSGNQISICGSGGT